MTQVLIMTAIVIYLLGMLAVGVVYSKKNNSVDDFYLGGRKLGPFVTAMSAEASDMSSWLLMGLPGVAYLTGMAEAGWTAIGLAVGTWLNWLIVAKRIRRYSQKLDAITVPQFFSKRWGDDKYMLSAMSAVIIIVFFIPYTASGFSACGKLFSTLFGASYVSMMIVGAIFVLLYTLLGGFLAESASDFMQGVVMFTALICIVAIGTVNAGGLGAVVENAKSIPGFFEFFGIANPELNEAGQQIAQNGVPVFGPSSEYGLLKICSMLAWGLGYFGMPQVLLRFMAIRREDELKMSRRIAMVWVVISLGVAVFIGIMGRALYPTEHLTASAAENIFITLATNALPPLLAGFVMAGILAATISSSDSYLLIAASAVAKNVYQGVVRKRATDKQVMTVTRITLLTIALIAIVIALDEDSIIFNVVSFAWAGFGATFGPLMLFSLFWKRINRAGAVAGMVSGAAMVFLWKLVISPLGGIFAIYELLPAFIVSSLCIVVVSLLTKAPSKELEEDFEAVKNGHGVA